MLERIEKMTKKRYTAYFTAALSLLYLLVFISFYTVKYLPSVNLLKIGDALYYITDTLSSVLNYCIPLVSTAAAVALAGGKIKAALLYSLLFALPRFFYLLPYYYLYEIAYGYDSFESLGLSFLISAALFLLTAAHIFLLYILVRFVTKKILLKEMKSELPPYKQKSLDKNEPSRMSLEADEKFKEELSSKGIFDLSHPLVAGIFAAAFFDFLLELLSECIDAAVYLTEYAGTYTPDEIILMVFSFIMILAKLLISHTAMIGVKKITLKATASEAK